jgi:putative copper resistance protein D
MTMAPDMSVAQHGATVILNLALAIAVGAGATMLWTARGASEWVRMQGCRVRHAGLAALAVAILASVGVLWLEAASMAEVPLMQAGEAARTMLTATHLGLAWKVGMAALIFSIAAMALATPNRGARGLAFMSLAGLALFLYTRSMVSHAAAAGDFSLILVVNWTHLILICLWIGEVIVGGQVVLASPPGEALDNRNDCARYVESLSASATFALVGIFVTGLFNAWYNLGSPKALLGNPYGTTLLIKLALVIVAVMLGGINRFVVMPGLIAALHTGGGTANKAARQFTVILRIEGLVLVAVLVMAAILSSTAPPTAG